MSFTPSESQVAAVMSEVLGAPVEAGEVAVLNREQIVNAILTKGGVSNELSSQAMDAKIRDVFKDIPIVKMQGIVFTVVKLLRLNTKTQFCMADFNAEQLSRMGIDVKSIVDEVWDIVMESREKVGSVACFAFDGQMS